MAMARVTQTAARKSPAFAAAFHSTPKREGFVSTIGGLGVLGYASTARYPTGLVGALTASPACFAESWPILPFLVAKRSKTSFFQRTSSECSPPNPSAGASAAAASLTST